MLHQTVAVAGPNTQSIDVTALAAGQADVRARFHYHNAFAALWWQVDDVILGPDELRAARRAVSWSATSSTRTRASGLNGATVDERRRAARSATTFATPDDPAQPDGLYVLFSESASQSFTASLDLYAPQTKSLTVVPNATQRLDFQPDGRTARRQPPAALGQGRPRRDRRRGRST